MKRIASAVTLFMAVQLAGNVYSADELTAESPITYAAPKIMGGYEAPAGVWPWMTALLQSSVSDTYQAQYCGGALIAANWVLTAGHCVEGMSASEINVAVGAHDLGTWSGTRIGVKRVVLHPGYATYLANDIALLELQSNASQTPITLFSGDSVQGVNPALSGFLTTLIGWGLADKGYPEYWYYPERLRQVNLPVVSNTYCSSAFGTTLDNSHICAGYSSTMDACGGDSGGPMMLQIDGAWTHVGLVSYGSDCETQNGYYGVYTKTSSFTDFIKQYVPSAKFTAGPVSSSSSAMPWLMLLLN